VEGVLGAGSVRQGLLGGALAMRARAAMAAALPLNGLPAWRVYLGLPLSGSRLPEGGPDAFGHVGSALPGIYY
jgi:hypothetical protein